jgi:hypothetical protein
MTPEVLEFLRESSVAKDLVDYLTDYLQHEHTQLIAMTAEADIETVRRQNGICVGIGRVINLMRSPDRHHHFARPFS